MKSRRFQDEQCVESSLSPGYPQDSAFFSSKTTRQLLLLKRWSPTSTASFSARYHKMAPPEHLVAQLQTLPAAGDANQQQQFSQIQIQRKVN